METLGEYNPVLDDDITHNTPPSHSLVLKNNTGEVALLWATLLDGLYIYTRYRHQRGVWAQQLFTEAKQWLDSEDEDWLCSFNNLCRLFNFDPNHVRAGIRRLPKGAKIPKKISASTPPQNTFKFAA